MNRTPEGNDATEGAQGEIKTINPPVYHASTVLFNNYEALRQANEGTYPGITYGTQGSPTQEAFERALADLEGGYATKVFPSGISAITHVLQAFTRCGDHILVCDNVYGPTRRFCDRILSKFGVETTYIPPDAGENISAFIRPETRLIFLESPGSNTFEIQDMPAIVRVAKAKNLVTMIDNTWATPLYYKPFQLGVDISIHSVTKYISGHSDVLLGTVTTNKKRFSEFFHYYHTLEVNASQADCYLALRGLKTLAVRLKHHEQSALEMAHWVNAQKQVETVLHPALPEHPEHDLWKRDFSGSSGLFGFILKQEYPEERIAAFVDGLRFFGLGYSWGGFKSLLTVGRYRRTTPSRYQGRTLFRVSIGFEDVADLRDDLDQAMNRLSGPVDSGN
ncbi:MAG: cystathionine beta-lyase [Deltaproteobacteria bacterium]|nr:cystathionine beta-lyase [Deltaproteobacteria bacterium]